MSSEFLVRLRDGAQMIADAAQQYLETMAPRDATRHDMIPDLSQIIWKDTTGKKGPFQVAEEETNKGSVAFQQLLDYLKQHDGRCTIDSYFFWTMPNERTAGRKPIRK